MMIHSPWLPETPPPAPFPLLLASLLETTAHETFLGFLSFTARALACPSLSCSAWLEGQGHLSYSLPIPTTPVTGQLLPSDSCSEFFLYIHLTQESPVLGDSFQNKVVLQSFSVSFYLS